MIKRIITSAPIIPIGVKQPNFVLFFMKSFSPSKAPCWVSVVMDEISGVKRNDVVYGPLTTNLVNGYAVNFIPTINRRKGFGDF